jgi:hypothetical protein
MTDEITTQKNNSSTREFERSYLRAEVAANKKLVFERALLIAGAALAATLLPKDAKGIELLGIPAMGALAFNLWFTVNRLTSSSRIIAYVQLFHESKNDLTWVGWENALRLYRVWRARCGEEKSKTEEQYEEITQYDNLSFYKPILALHLAMAVAITTLMSFRAWILEPTVTPVGEVPVSVFFALNLAAASLFVIWALSVFPPNKLQYGIEKNRILWAAIFHSYSNGELKRIVEAELPDGD